MYDLRNKLEGDEEAAKRGNTSLSCWVTFIYRVPSNISICVMRLPAFLPPFYFLLLFFSGSVLKVVDIYLHILSSDSDPAPAVTPRPPSGAGPALPVCVSWRNCLPSWADQINRTCLWGWEIGGLGLFSSMSEDKELFDGEERNKSDLGLLI